ncbi:hypothetical protein BGX28_007437 [Mortierella sp. GBA30]|nr:hypothetical protein BGX28_007437 [Mortierella sp. GBA30]
MELLVDCPQEPFSLPKTKAKISFSARSPFMLPELDRLIASHLDRVTLASASRVCKLWHSIFNPVLWKRLSLQHVAADDDYDDEFNFITRRTPPSSLPSLTSSCSSTCSSVSAAETASSPPSSLAPSTAPADDPYYSLTLLQQTFLHSSSNKVLKGLMRYGPLVQELRATGITDQEMALIAVLCPSLRVLELVGGRYTAENLTDLFRKRGDSIQVARFRSCVQLRDIFQPLTHLKNLREFELYGSFVGNTITSTTFFEDDLFPVLRRCPHLHSILIEQVYIIDQRVEQGGWDGGWDGGGGIMGLDQQNAHFSPLHSNPTTTTAAIAGSPSSSLSKSSSSTSILSAQLRSSGLGPFAHYATRHFRPTGTSSLKSLVLDCGDIPDSVIMALLTRCPLLEQLSLDWSRELSDFSLGSLQYICPNITEISLSRCIQLSAEGFKVLFKSYPNLISIDLNGNILSDAVLESLARSCPFLQHLSINSCQNVTDLGMQTILMNCCRLEYFSLRFISGLSFLLFDDLMMIPRSTLPSPSPSSSSSTSSSPSLPIPCDFGNYVPFDAFSFNRGKTHPITNSRPWACQQTLQSLHLPDLVLPNKTVVDKLHQRQRQHRHVALLSSSDETFWYGEQAEKEHQTDGDQLIRSRLQQIDRLKHLTLGGHNLDLRQVLDGLHRPRELESLRITKLKKVMTWSDAQWLIKTAAPGLKRLAIPMFGNREVTDWIEDQRPGLLSFEK